ncbi:MAG TPA: DUF1801 domain-containing protein, partial [Bacteroidia bacterium]
YIDQITEDKKQTFNQIREVILKNIPKGFVEQMNYGMIGYVVPHSIFPAGYHCDPNLPLPFANLAAQKNNVSLYHMGLYADKELLEWFTSEHAKRSKKKLDMGKSCIRYKKPEDVPLDLIGELFQKFNPQKWIELYSKNLKK